MDIADSFPAIISTVTLMVVIITLISSNQRSSSKDIQENYKDILNHLEKVKSVQRDTDIKIAQIETTLITINKDINEIKQKQNEIIKELYSTKQGSEFSMGKQMIRSISLGIKRQILESDSEDASKQIANDEDES